MIITVLVILIESRRIKLFINVARTEEMRSTHCTKFFRKPQMKVPLWGHRRIIIMQVVNSLRKREQNSTKSVQGTITIIYEHCNTHSCSENCKLLDWRSN
jgi:hypothetical protein